MRCGIKATVSAINVVKQGKYFIAFAAPDRRIIDVELVYGIKVWKG
jgi:hypothetical protein